MSESESERICGEEVLRLGRIVARYEEDAEADFEAVLTEVVRRPQAESGLSVARLGETDELQVVAAFGSEEAA